MEAKRASARSENTERRVESSADENGDESKRSLDTVENSGRSITATAQETISRDAYASVSTQL
eukprot:214938-Pleurochrysis_carterae.AAC.1